MSRRSVQTAVIAAIGICFVAAGLLLMRPEKTDYPDIDIPDPPELDPVSMDMPDSSRGDTADASVTNVSGDTYLYRIFNQKAGYNNYSKYLSAHGCSTCALTTILRTTVPELAELTPDRTLTEILPEAAGQETFDKNFGKAMKLQMPVTLSGMTKVLDRYGVEYRRPDADKTKWAGEITSWLLSGDPVIFTFGNASEAHLSRNTHTVLLLGLDRNGHVIIGDSLHKSAAHWGMDGLVKRTDLTVEDMLSFVRTENWQILKDTVSDSHIFYKNSSDRGYLLVRKSNNNN
ncbi:MAG: hypothetical protein IJI11_06425 [Mogibacterium sp.]|nr:hypothetical protein [Mogibacterium sp.]